MPKNQELTCKGWIQEAALRMLKNNLHPDVAEDPEHLIVYGGNGKAARNQEALEVIFRELQNLENDQTLLVQSGKAVGVFKTHKDAPRVLIANSNLVGHWANWEEFRKLEAAGLIMFGQMTAGSWIYIGTQGILQGTYETFVAVGRKHFGGSLAGRLVVTGGLGGMGGAQPLAVKMAGGVCLVAEVDPQRVQRRLDTRYLDKTTDDLDKALEWAKKAAEKKEAVSIGYQGNIVDLLQALLEKGETPDVLTDQTSAHDLLNGYVPNHMTLKEANELRKNDPDAYLEKARKTVVEHVQAMMEMHDRGAIVFDYGNNIRQVAHESGCKYPDMIPGFVPAYIRPLFCEGSGPFRWVALSGDPEDIYKTDEALKELFPEKTDMIRWLDMAREQVHFQGLPARICWLGYGERAKAGLKFNEMVRDGILKAPIVIGRDHLDCGSVASPFRETESMKDGSDAVADWAILNALVNAVNGASWVSFHHGGGVGMGYSLHAGQVIVADGTDDAAKRLERVLTSDPGMGVIRHVDAGYERAVEVAKERGVHVPHMK